MVDVIGADRVGGPSEVGRFTVAVVDGDSDLGGWISDVLETERSDGAGSDGSGEASEVRAIVLLSPGSGRSAPTADGQGIAFIECLEEALAPTIGAIIAGRVQPHAERPPSPISAMERRILHLATKGWSDAQIARRLRLETAEVKTRLNEAILKAARACRPGSANRNGLPRGLESAD
jgi:hypothetical protein